MKKVLIAALIAGFSLSATAAETIRFATEASYPPFESIDATTRSLVLTSTWHRRCVKRLMQPVLSLTRRLTA